MDKTEYENKLFCEENEATSKEYLFSPTRRSQRLQKLKIPTDSHKENVSTVPEDEINANSVPIVSNRKFLEPSVSDVNYFIETNERTIEASRPSLKLYSNKRKTAFSLCNINETFGLPDNSIFHQTTPKTDRKLDTSASHPNNLSVINVEFVNEPWLVSELKPEYVEVCDEVRIKGERAEHFKKSDLTCFNGDGVYTSTPNGGEKVKTKRENTVNITTLKDNLKRVLENAIKRPENMQIQLVENNFKNDQDEITRSCKRRRKNGMLSEGEKSSPIKQAKLVYFDIKTKKIIRAASSEDVANSFFDSNRHDAKLFCEPKRHSISLNNITIIENKRSLRSKSQENLTQSTPKSFSEENTSEETICRASEEIISGEDNKSTNKRGLRLKLQQTSTQKSSSEENNEEATSEETVCRASEEIISEEDNKSTNKRGLRLGLPENSTQKTPKTSSEETTSEETVLPALEEIISEEHSKNTNKRSLRSKLQENLTQKSPKSPLEEIASEETVLLASEEIISQKDNTSTNMRHLRSKLQENLTQKTQKSSSGEISSEETILLASKDIISEEHNKGTNKRSVRTKLQENSTHKTPKSSSQETTSEETVLLALEEIISEEHNKNTNKRSLRSKLQDNLTPKSSSEEIASEETVTSEKDNSSRNMRYLRSKSQENLTQKTQKSSSEEISSEETILLASKDIISEEHTKGTNKRSVRAKLQENSTHKTSKSSSQETPSRETIPLASEENISEDDNQISNKRSLRTKLREKLTGITPKLSSQENNEETISKETVLLASEEDNNSTNKRNLRSKLEDNLTQTTPKSSFEENYLSSEEIISEDNRRSLRSKSQENLKRRPRKSLSPEENNEETTSEENTCFASEEANKSGNKRSLRTKLQETLIQKPRKPSLEENNEENIFHASQEFIKNEDKRKLSSKLQENLTQKLVKSIINDNSEETILLSSAERNTNSNKRNLRSKSQENLFHKTLKSSSKEDNQEKRISGASEESILEEIVSTNEEDKNTNRRSLRSKSQENLTKKPTKSYLEETINDETLPDASEENILKNGENKTTNRRSLRPKSSSKEDNEETTREETVPEENISEDDEKSTKKRILRSNSQEKNEFLLETSQRKLRKSRKSQEETDASPEKKFKELNTTLQENEALLELITQNDEPINNLEENRVKNDGKLRSKSHQNSENAKEETPSSSNVPHHKRVLRSTSQERKYVSLDNTKNLDAKKSPKKSRKSKEIFEIKPENVIIDLTLEETSGIEEEPPDIQPETFDSSKIDHIKKEIEDDDYTKITNEETQGFNVEIKTEKDVLLQNGITSDVKVMITPMKDKIKVESEDDEEETRKNEETVPVQRSLRSQTTEEETKTIKQESDLSEYMLGDFVWAKIAKSPYWPAVICEDPDTEDHMSACKGVDSKTKLNIIDYHVRFFGDRGKRAWIGRSHLMLYCSKDDLEMIANKLKAENKTHTSIKPYVVPSGAFARWKKGVDELESVKTQSYEEILEFLFKSAEKKPSTDTISDAKPKTKRKLSSSPTPNENKSKKMKIETKPTKTIENESKTSTNDSDICVTSEMYSFEAQNALFRRNYLFKGVPKEKICQSCLKVGQVYKCRGRCGGFYHRECALEIGRESPNTTEKNQVEIVTVKSKTNTLNSLPKTNLPPDYENLSLSERIDYKMKEIMESIEEKNIYYVDSSSDTNSEENFAIVTSPKKKKMKKMNQKKNVHVHVTADCDFDRKRSSIDARSYDDDTSNNGDIYERKRRIKEEPDFGEDYSDPTYFKCGFCSSNKEPYCFVCDKEISEKGSDFRQKCSLYHCGKYYHLACLKLWPQTQWSLIPTTKNKSSEIDSFVCPVHVCHTCTSEDPRTATARCSSAQLVKCVQCPASYHSTNYCIPAGTEILSTSQVICPRHRPTKTHALNTTWCFICSEGGNLICCETCPTSVHPECLQVNVEEDDKFICEDCESGRFPLYDEIVWVKLGHYRWWPAVILFPNEVPINVQNIKHQQGDFVVRFFGTNDHYWVNKTRSFLFQEGDMGNGNERSKSKMEATFARAVEDAAIAHKLKREFKLRKEAENMNSLKPPPFIKIKSNRAVGNVRLVDLDLSHANACECDPDETYPCGVDSYCINRLLMTECDPDVCPAGTRCRNQAFEKREYPPMVPHKTQGRGWGLKTLAPIKKGQFVIEYVGEVIDVEEYQRRIQKMHQQKEENYYFLTIDNQRMLDAGPKGNVSRFMNHSCDPNCETQKWTVNGETRVGLFALRDIPSGAELTFNYNLECVGKEKKVCRCGAPNCSGFIGVKSKQETVETKKPKKSYQKKKHVRKPPELPPCFVCGKENATVSCTNKICNKSFHRNCLRIEEIPDVNKFVCPRHNCNICSNRTIRCCVKCLNSYCPSHSEGNVRYDNLLGFVCSQHDSSTSVVPALKPKKRKSAVLTEESAVTSTTSEEFLLKKKKNGSLKEEERVKNDYDLDNSVTSTPRKNGEIFDSSDSEISEGPQKRKSTRAPNKIQRLSNRKNTARDS